jgi:hypothetical protein
MIDVTSLLCGGTVASITILVLHKCNQFSQTERLTIILAAHGLEELFFPVVLLCQFFVLAGNRFWFYILMYIT